MGRKIWRATCVVFWSLWVAYMTITAYGNFKRGMGYEITTESKP